MISIQEMTTAIYDTFYLQKLFSCIHISKFLLY